MTRDAGGRPYELVLRGEIGDHYALLFDGMRLERVTGHTVLTGRMVDQARLHGVIARIQELGVELVSVNVVDNAKEHAMATVTASDGTRLYYKDWGDGPPVILSH